MKYRSLRKKNLQKLVDAFATKGFPIAASRLDPLSAYNKINFTTKTLDAVYRGNMISVPLAYYWQENDHIVAESIATEFALMYEPSLYNWYVPAGRFRILPYASLDFTWGLIQGGNMLTAQATTHQLIGAR